MEPVTITGLRVIETDPAADPRWERFVESHPRGLVYLHPGWIRALSEEYGQDATCLACEDSDGRLLGVLPLFHTRGLPFHLDGHLTARRLSSLPRTPLGGPLSSHPEVSAILMKAAVERCRQVGGIRLQLKRESQDLDGLVENVVCTPWRFSYVLTLPSDPAELRFGNNVARHRIKWAVNKAIKLGVEVREAGQEDELRQWYRLYLEAMRRNAVPPRAYRFFHSLWEHLHPAGILRLLLAEQVSEGLRTLIAGSIFLSYGDTVSWAFTGCRTSALPLHPNDLIHWQAIHEACKCGFARYDFGEVAEEHPEIANFKSKWGAEAKLLYRYYFPGLDGIASAQEKSAGSVHGLLALAWCNLPLSATAKLGDWIYSWL
jgi:hypothetical protein